LFKTEVKLHEEHVRFQSIRFQLIDIMIHLTSFDSLARITSVGRGSRWQIRHPEPACLALAFTLAGRWGRRTMFNYTIFR